MSDARELTGPDQNSEQWRRALDVADTVRATCQQLKLAPEQEWLRQVMTEAADQIRSAVLWAASSASAAEQPERHSLRPYVVAADATRSDAAMASYFLDFLRSERLINEGTAQRVGGQLLEIERGMELLSRRLRQEMGFDPYGLAPAS